MIVDIVKVFIPATLSFFIGIGFSVFYARFLYKNKLWKKKSGKIDMDGKSTPIFNELHKNKETGTPRMGGVVVWASAAIVILAVWILSQLVGTELTEKLDFLSRNQTWIPLFTLVAGGFVGLIDDLLEIKGNGGHVSGGLSLSKRLIIVGIIGLLISLWFFFKLDVQSIGIPFYGDWHIGYFFIPLFVAVMVGLYSGGIIDGIDGLAGGIFAIIFTAYAIIAFYLDQINLAAFNAVVVGGILAFLWFNIPPARFFMSETGSMALTITLAVVAFMTDSLGGGHGVIILPIIAIPLVATSLSVIIQLYSKKFRNKKVFKVAPIHHHFEAVGWPAYKVTMRFWVIGVIFALIGVTIGLIDSPRPEADDTRTIIQEIIEDSHFV